MNIWLKYCAFASLLGFPIALLGSRFDLFNFNIAMLIILLSILIALVVFLISGFLSIKQKRRYPVSAKNAMVALLLSSIPLIGLGYIMVGARDIPRIHNISSDVVNPPKFVKAHQLRSAEHNPLEYDVNKIASLQQAAYPKVKTLVVNMTRAQARTRSLEVIEQLSWDLVDNNQASNIIEASDTTALWRFTDDIVIRLQANQSDDQVSIDLRSVSRIGQSDLGANAKRIEKFIDTF